MMVHAVPQKPWIKPLKMAVLLSGSGRTLVNLAQRIEQGSLSASITHVVSSRSDVLGVTRAGELGIPVSVVSRRQHADVKAFSQAVYAPCRDSGAELVVLAGFLSLLEVPEDYLGRTINIHPSLLPSFGGKGMYGHHVHEAVLAAGCKVAGCTVHYCDQRYDTGPIITQQCCEVREDDTPDSLAARVFEQECEAYPRAIQWIAEGRVRIEGRVTRILPAMP